VRKGRILISPWNDFLHAWIISHLQRFGICLFPFLFLLGKMMTVSIARHITVRTHGPDGRACFPTESLSSSQISLSHPEIVALVKACMRVSQSRWLMAGGCFGYTAGTGWKTVAQLSFISPYKGLSGVSISAIIFTGEETEALRR
jgi:hypothetical protein